MTQVRMNWRRLTLTLEGHAGSAPAGQDLVCAAESMLTQALVQTLMDMNREKKLLGLFLKGNQRKGVMRIEAAPEKEYHTEVRACFRLVVTGLRMLEEEYPEYIKISEGGQENGDLGQDA